MRNKQRARAGILAILLVITMVFQMFGTSTAAVIYASEAEAEVTEVVSEPTETIEESKEEVVEPEVVEEIPEAAEAATEVTESAAEETVVPNNTESTETAPAPKATEEAVVGTPDEGAVDYALNGSGAEYAAWVASSTFLVEDESGNMVPADQLTSIPEYASFHFTLSVNTKQEVGVRSIDRLVYELPKGLLPTANSGELTDSTTNAKTASWNISGNYLYIQFTPSYLKYDKNVLHANIDLSGKLDTTANVTEENGVRRVDMGILGTYTVLERINKVANVDIQKKGISRVNNNDTEEVVYQIQVKAGKFNDTGVQDNNVDLTNVVISDEYHTWEKPHYAIADAAYLSDDSWKSHLSIDTISCVDQHGNERKVTYDSNTEAFTLEGNLQPNDVITLQYTLKADPGMYEDLPQGAQDSPTIVRDGDKTNQSDRSWTNRRVTSDAYVVTLPAGMKDTITENSEWDTSDVLRNVDFVKTWLWTGAYKQVTSERAYNQIKVNEGTLIDITGWKLTNTIPENQTLITDITVTNLTTGNVFTIAKEDANNGDFTYTFPENGEYRLTFDTHPDQENVKCGTHPILTNTESGQTYGAVYEAAFPADMPSKTHPNVDYAGNTISWRTYVNRGNQIKAGDIYQDWLRRAHNDTGKASVWTESSADDYHITDDQIASIKAYKISDGTAVSFTAKRLDGSTLGLGDQPGILDAFEITFNEDVEGAVYIEYTTYANFSSANGYDNVEFFNGARLLNKDRGQKFYVSDSVRFSATSAIKKTLVENKNSLVWRIEVNSNYELLGQSVVKDIIPKGLNDIDEETDIRVIEIVTKDENGNVSYVTDSYTKSIDFTYDPATRELKTKFEDLSYTKVTYLVTTYVTTENLLNMMENGGEMEFNNEADLYAVTTDTKAEVHLVDSSAVGTIGYQILEKGVAENLSGNRASYTLKVNPSGQKLADESVKYLTVEDIIPNNRENGLYLLTNTLKVKVDGQDGVRGDDYLLNDADLTESGFKLQVKDGVKVEITYDVYVAGNANTSKDVANDANLYWDGISKNVSVKNRSNVTIQNSGQTDAAVLVHMLKQDSETGDALSGAQYQLYTYENGTLKESGIEMYPTDANGMARSKAEVKTGVIYALKETAAPKGYLNDTSEHYFVLYNTPSEIPANLPEGTETIFAKLGELSPVVVEDDPIPTIDIELDKTWIGSKTKADGTEYEQVVAQLWSKRDGVWERDTQSGITNYAFITAENNWTGSFKNVPITDADGNQIEYEIREEELENNQTNLNGFPYAVVIEGNETLNDGIDGTKHVSITNYELTELDGTKIWDDDSNRDGVRPEAITLHVYPQGSTEEITDITISFDETNSDVWTWNIKGRGLPKYDVSGNEIVYEVVEDKASEDYDDPTYNGYDITNTHTPETTEISVTKIWDDDKDAFGIRPESLKITLYADGDIYLTQDVTEESDWKTTFKDLPVYKIGAVGQAVNYTVGEETVTGYTGSEAKAVEDGYEFTNTVQKTSLSLEKVWKMSSKNALPKNITVQLLQDGEAYGDAVTVTKDTNWKTSFEDLPLYKKDNSGKIVECKYTVEETKIGDEDADQAAFKISYDTKKNKDGSYKSVITNTEVVTKSGSTGSSAKPVKTGDAAPILPYAILLLIAAAAIAAIVRRRQKI